MLTFLNTAPVLVLGAHPDDETMCAGLIARLIENNCEVHHYYFSDCSISTQLRGFPPAQLIAECNESRDILGIDNDKRGAFDFPVRDFPAYRQQILEVLISLKRSINPGVVLTAAKDDIHQDHSTLTNEVIRAFKSTTILGYEMPWNQFQANHDCLVSLEQRHLDKKISAIAAYRTQADAAYATPQFMTSLAHVRGLQAGTEFAESYQIIRLVI